MSDPSIFRGLPRTPGGEPDPCLGRTADTFRRRASGNVSSAHSGWSAWSGNTTHVVPSERAGEQARRHKSERGVGPNDSTRTKTINLNSTRLKRPGGFSRLLGRETVLSLSAFPIAIAIAIVAKTRRPHSIPSLRDCRSGPTSDFPPGIRIFGKATFFQKSLSSQNASESSGSLFAWTKRLRGRSGPARFLPGRARNTSAATAPGNERLRRPVRSRFGWEEQRPASRLQRAGRTELCVDPGRRRRRDLEQQWIPATGVEAVALVSEAWQR